jgi:hypothetical protein
VRWTVFKSQLCGFAAQKYSTKLRLKNCRLARRYVESKGARMKAIVSGILGVGLGALGVWLYTSNIANDSDKIGTEISIGNTIKQIELLKANKHSELEVALISSLPCQIQKYEELISANSEASATFSNKLIAQAKQYSGEQSCPN